MPRYGARPKMRDPGGGPSTPALVGEIGRRLVELAQKEAELARAEMVSDVRAGRNAVVALAAGLVVTLLGVALLLVAVVLALSQVMAGWLAALIVAAVVLAAGTAIAIGGWTQRPRSALARTRSSLREDWEWLKAQVG